MFYRYYDDTYSYRSHSYSPPRMTSKNLCTLPLGDDDDANLLLLLLISAFSSPHALNAASLSAPPRMLLSLSAPSPSSSDFANGTRPRRRFNRIPNMRHGIWERVTAIPLPNLQACSTTSLLPVRSLLRRNKDEGKQLLAKRLISSIIIAVDVFVRRSSFCESR